MAMLVVVPGERAPAEANENGRAPGPLHRLLRRVKRWRRGTMVKRSVAAGILEAQRGFRRLRGGYKGIPALVLALTRYAEQIDRVDAHQEIA